MDKIDTSHTQYNTINTQDVGYYIDQMAQTCLNRCLCALCHHPVPDYAHPHRQIYHHGITHGGLPSIFCRQLACQVGVCALIHGELDGRPRFHRTATTRRRNQSTTATTRRPSLHTDVHLILSSAELHGGLFVEIPSGSRRARRAPVCL